MFQQHNRSTRGADRDECYPSSAFGLRSSVVSEMNLDRVQVGTQSSLSSRSFFIKCWITSTLQILSCLIIKVWDRIKMVFSITIPCLQNDVFKNPLCFYDLVWKNISWLDTVLHIHTFQVSSPAQLFNSLLTDHQFIF